MKAQYEKEKLTWLNCLNDSILPLKEEVHRAFDANYQPQSDQIETSAQKFLDEFLWFADALYQKKKSDS